MEWVEKASLEKIRRLLEVYERGCHYKVLLTSNNLTDVRRNPAPYSLPIIQRPLPPEIIDREHFVIVDLMRLISGDASTSRGAEAEIADWRSVAPSPLGPSASNSEGSGSAHPAFRWGERDSLSERLPLPSRGGKSAPRVLKVKRKKATWRGYTLGTQVKDFVPWVLNPANPRIRKRERKRR